jgi:porphobilinogen synthase
MTTIPHHLIPVQRPRRLRYNQTLRSMLSDHRLSPTDFIAPLFCTGDKTFSEEIKTMPGVFRLGMKEIKDEVRELLSVGVQAVCLFPVVPDKDKNRECSLLYQKDFFYYKIISELKKEFPTLVIMTDVALDPYSTDGHDGLVDQETGEIINDATLQLLMDMSVLQAKAGADIIGPSDMMDGRVKAIRYALDQAGFHKTLIMSYCVKYASSFYGPFRDALDSAPKSGNKLSYQMDPANDRAAFIECELDTLEGADILMVKPGMPYLDILHRLSLKTHLPLSAYQVSGEYAMLVFAAKNGALDLDGAILESLIGFKRAGASLILTYFAKRAATLLAK